MAAKFALIQAGSVGEPEKNLETARRMVRGLKDEYAPDFFIFPEYFMSLFPSGTDRRTRLATAEGIDGPFVEAMRRLAEENRAWMTFGMNERVGEPGDDRNYSTAVTLGSDGSIAAVCRKTHLYNAFQYAESDDIKPGERLFEPIDTPFGRIGMFICYEARFPEVARFQRLRGADIMLVPAAWYGGPLKSHHLRAMATARAIENTSYVLVCDQMTKDCLGESVAIDPMGVPIAAAGESETALICSVSLDRVREVRAKLPSFEHRRPELYD